MTDADALAQARAFVNTPYLNQDALINGLAAELKRAYADGYDAAYRVIATPTGMIIRAEASALERGTPPESGRPGDRP